jgi:PAS domain S-box-containing protein
MAAKDTSSAPRVTSRFHQAQVLGGFALAYFVATRLAVVFEAGGSRGVTAAWPASGLVLGVLLAVPATSWPAFLATVAVTNAVSSLAGGHPWSNAIGFSLVDALEGALAAGLVVRVLGRRPELSRLRDVLAVIVLAAGVGNSVTAVAGGAVAAWLGILPFREAWLAWWLSNGTGMLLVAPLVLAVVQRRLRLPRRRLDQAELVGLYALLVVLGTWVFSQRTIQPSVIALPYLVFPALIWAALRFGPFHACVASLIVGITAGWHTLHGGGPFSLLGPSASQAFALQAFLAVTAVSSVLAATVVEERHQAEESLAVHRHFTEHAADAILFFRVSDGRILDANAAAVAAYGYSMEEFRSLRIGDLLLPESVEGLPGRIAQADRDGLLFETIHRRRDGTTFPIEVHASGATLRRERVIFSVHRDLSARKRAETATREAEAASARAQGRFKAVFENARDAILLIDDGRVVDANPQAERLFGLSSSQLLGRTVAALSPETQHDGRSSIAAAQAHTDAALAGQLQYFEWTYRRADGMPFEAEVGLTPIELEGRPLLIGVVRDITERRALEEQLRQAQKMEAVGRLAGGVAHDFNNLLTVIKGYTELALLELAGRSPREPLEEVARAAERASSLTRQLLAFSRKQILEPALLDPNAIVAEMDRMLRRLIGEHIELMTVATTGVWPVYADRSQVEQVVLNLALNGRDAMPEGGRLTIETANAELDEPYVRQHADVRAGSYVVLAVSDTGTGISAEARAHIFEPFFTTKERGKGTGLGLSTVYGIVKQSGGHVTFYSEPGRGTTFRVYLPAANRAEGVQARRPVAGDECRGHETVLLVEDDPAVRGLASKLLERWGYRVLVAPGGAEAIERSRAEAGPIDLLLTDVVMPRIGGREVADQLVRERPGLKVLFMSGYTENAIVHHGVLDPGVALIQKPFSPAAFGRKVREVLGQARESEDGKSVGGRDVESGSPVGLP